MVVISHLTGFHKIDQNLALECSFGWVAVSVFFFYSGYGLMNGLEEKGELYWNDFLRRRISKVLLPLFLFYGLYYICDILLHGTNLISFEKILLIFFSDDPYLPYSWFVSWLLMIYMLFYIAGTWSCNCQISFMKCFAFLFVILYLLILFSKMGPWVKVSIPCFLFGTIYRKNETRFLKISTKTSIIVLFVSLFAFLISYNWIRICMVMGCSDKIVYSSVHLYGGNLAFVLFYIMLSKNIKELNVQKIQLLDSSYELYLCQGIVFMLVAIFVSDSYLYYLYCLIGCMLFGYFINRLFNVIFKRIR